jgi:hypothetical protein
MQAIAFAAPLLPGKTEADLEAMTSVMSGERRSDHAASRKRAGIKRESAWLQRTPSGDVVVVLIEADDVQSAMGTLATSQEPFDVWFRDHIKDAHGMDMAEGFPPPEQVLDFRA